MVNVGTLPGADLTATLDDATTGRARDRRTRGRRYGSAHTIERSADAGATWEPVRGASSLAIAFATKATLYDYEAREVALTYRAPEGTISDQQLVSDYATADVAGMLSSSGWNLKCRSTRRSTCSTRT